MADYPEHEKLRAVRPEAQACGDFVGWLESEGLAICRYHENADGDWHPLSFSREKLLAKRFGINLDVIEAEKLAMLATLNPALAA